MWRWCQPASALFVGHSEILAHKLNVDKLSGKKIMEIAIQEHFTDTVIRVVCQKEKILVQGL